MYLDVFNALALWLPAQIETYMMHSELHLKLTYWIINFKLLRLLYQNITLQIYVQSYIMIILIYDIQIIFKFDVLRLFWWWIQEVESPILKMYQTVLAHFIRFSGKNGVPCISLDFLIVLYISY